VPQSEDCISELLSDGQTNGGNSRIISTGFRGLDAATDGGLRPGTLTVIASRPGIGRTTFLTDICRHVSLTQGLPAGLWTLEEQRNDLSARILAAEARVPLQHIRADAVTDEGLIRIARRLSAVQEMPLYLSAPASLTVAELAERAERLVTEHGVRLVALDGIQDVRPEQRNALREREVGDIVRDLKTLARELEVPVLATSHLNRSAEGRYRHRPELDDLRESGAITYAADLILLLHRDDAYEIEKRPGEADIYVAKNRHSLRRHIVLAFQGHYGRFVDLPEDWVPEDEVQPQASPDFLASFQGGAS
jgi:replicative DNA helicase